MASRSSGTGKTWLGPVIAGSGFLVPIPVGLVLAGPAGATVAVVAALLVGAILIAIGFRIVGSQERAERAGRRDMTDPSRSTDKGGRELQARLSEIQERNRTD